MSKKKQAKVKKQVKKHTGLIIFFGMVLVILLVAFGTKLFLYLNLILGNDIVVKLAVDKSNLYLEHGQEEQITFEAKVTTNPFCTALCTSQFLDISKNNILEQDEFKLQPAIPLKKSYLLKPTLLGTGLDLYRFDMECHSIPTILCHTNQEPSTRSILITLSYNLSDQEYRLKELLKEQLSRLTNELSMLQGNYIVIENTSQELSHVVIFDDKTIIAKNMLARLKENMRYLQAVWNQEDYTLVAENILKINNDFQNATMLFAEVNNSLSTIVTLYNRGIDDLHQAQQDLENLRSLVLTNETNAVATESIITDFNDIVTVYDRKTPLNQKLDLVNYTRKRISELATSTKETIKKQVMNYELELDTNYDVLCQIYDYCMQHPTIEDRANQQEFDLNKACRDITKLKILYAELDLSLDLNQSYPETEQFWNNISLKVKNIKQNITSTYLSSVPENMSNTVLIKELLFEEPLAETENYTDYNLTAALAHELISQQPENCTSIELPFVNEINIDPIKIIDNLPIQSDFVFEDPHPKCCVFGTCKDCCITEECRNDPSTYPIVFLHGHAVNKDLSAEYSLEGFNKIQKRLEKDGYLNAGTITMYTLKNESPGIWGFSGVPLTIRTSYYFDIFQQPDNYIVVQAKSENIDTYAVRLKDLIDIIQYKTGKPKVTIIAFSMGGLVTRRYLQIFGTQNVDRIILIGTPNKGIVGKIADYCPITGEKLECRDMNADSLFINKLNSGPNPNIPMYNILGTGCVMKDNIGDGVVLKEKAWLDGAHNYVINGTCLSPTEPLHLMLRDIDVYPEVYSIIIGALKEKSGDN